ncbi:MAG: response regulator [Bacteroidales bacterium]|jgi:CheY-like chemotaxis protein|nr:response regulator [Bacteroidales bacterium]
MMEKKKSNNNILYNVSELSKENLYYTISSLSDFLFVLDTEGLYIDVQFPHNNHSIDLNPKSILNKHYKEIKIGDDFNLKLDKFLTKLKETTINQQFEFTISKDIESNYFSANISELQSEKGQVLGYVILAHEISKIKQREATLSKDLEEHKEKISNLEKEVNFYIKQGDVITNQRTKVQKERDRLEVEKTDIAKQKAIMEEDLNFIMKQGDKIAEQKYKIKIQHDIVRKQNKKIEDSILYAKRIQSAVLPPNRFIQHLLSEHFIFYKPRDIVSGDFYWTKQVGDKIFIAAADCTGHGVPGALMSMLGITFLNEIITKTSDIHADEILNELRIHIISSLRQTGSTGESRDGLDIALCIIDFEKQIIEYAGANNPLYLIRDNELIETKADRMPIGIHRRAKESFHNNIIEIQKDDLIYIFSDGFVDQFGGEDGRKYLSANFRKLLLDNCTKTLHEQKLIIERSFEEWKGERKQLDDILVIGFKISFSKEEVKSKLGYDWAGKTILIAEDDETNVLLLKKVFEKTHAEIIHAENGKQAIKLFKTNPDIDLILMDIRMPVMDGIEATTQIKQIDRNVPIIVQTAFTMSSEKEKSFKAGCDDYISKPINIKELYATVCKYIEKND